MTTQPTIKSTTSARFARALTLASSIALTAAFALTASGCHPTTHDATPAKLGRTTDLREMEAHLDEPGPIVFSKVNAADWKIDLSGLLNLDHPKAEAAGLEDRKEPIQIYFYVLEHPTRGTFIVDTGVARSVAQRSDDMPVGGLVKMFMPIDDLNVHVDTKTWLEQQKKPLSGVFITHLHLDHILGLQDVPKNVPLYIGPQEPEDFRFLHSLGHGTVDQNLEGFGALQELAIENENESSVLDIFGDGSLYGMHVPGHTKGSIAYVARTTHGPELMTGDACHTAWGWQHNVEPGSFNTDGESAAHSLQRLEQLAARHPKMHVNLGHQSLPQPNKVAPNPVKAEPPAAAPAAVAAAPVSVLPPAP